MKIVTEDMRMGWETNVGGRARRTDKRHCNEKYSKAKKTSHENENARLNMKKG